MADILQYVRQWTDNFQRNTAESFSRMTVEKYISLVIIVGGYMLFRPYLMKIGSRFQTREHEKEVDPDEMAAQAAISPNSLRGKVNVPEDSDDEGEVEATGADWGKKARRRQREMVRKVLEAEERLRREQEEDEEDKDIEEFLVDN